MTAATHRYDVFLEGELVDLVVPDEHAILEDRWYAWLNDQPLTRNMEQGMYPNSPAQQMQFLQELRSTKSRIALLIKPKASDSVVGVVSLSKISHVTRQADVGMIVARRTSDFTGAFIGMEAKCLITEHAFETVGLERINSYQSAALKDWQKWQILFGYRLEGIQRKAFRKGWQSFDLLVSGCLLEDYLALKNLRGGRLWPGMSRMMDLIRKLPRQSLEEKLAAAIEDIAGAHYRSIVQST